MGYTLSRSQLLFDLYVAFECAKHNKSNKSYVRNFESNLNQNLNKLCDELYERRYKPQPSVCFIITDPKKREIFAANFRDRVVHHLYYNYTYELFNSTFIEDSYSCRIGKGIHYGVERLYKHIRSVTDNFHKEGYVLKMDIKGYFVHINRHKLLDIANNVLDKMASHKSRLSGLKYIDIIDYEFVHYLNEILILTDPTDGCIFKSDISEWNGLPRSKSQFFTDKWCGIPIGNLTSQLFSNVYLNVLDQYMKRVLKLKHYGRYVDDFYVVSETKDKLKEIIPNITSFLKKELFLDINQGKTQIKSTKHGVSFIGGYIKPHRIYVSNSTINRISKKINTIHLNEPEYIEASINSMLGIFSHYKSNTVKCHIMNKNKELKFIGYFDEDYNHFNTF